MDRELLDVEKRLGRCLYEIRCLRDSLHGYEETLEELDRQVAYKNELVMEHARLLQEVEYGEETV